MSFSLTDEILDPTKARSLEWSNSAFGLKQVSIRPSARIWLGQSERRVRGHRRTKSLFAARAPANNGDAPSAKMGTQEFHNVRSRGIFHSEQFNEFNLTV